MSQTRDPKAGGRSDFAPIEARHDGSRLAHWPPPFRSAHAPPKTINRLHSQAPKRATPRGWRMTRAMFSEFEEEE